MKTISIKCSNCQKEFQKPIAYIKQGEKRGQNNHFCSNDCSCSFNSKLQPILKQKRIDEYYKNPKKCLNCNSILKYENSRKYKTKYCSIKCAAIHTQKDGGHCHWSDEDKKRLSLATKSNPKWVLRHQRKRTKKLCLQCNKEFEVQEYRKNQKCCCRKCKNDWIKKTGYLKGKNGGYRDNSGTHKKGWYKGYFCMSSWELAWVIYQLDHNISFTRNTKGFTYNFKGKTKKYYPDFIVNGEYIEIKNYVTEQVNEKIKQFPYKLKMLYKNDLTDVFKYVEDKYGKDFIKLYENKID